MSILDIIRGDKPLIRPTMRQRIATVEQDFSRMMNLGANAPRFVSRCGGYVREIGPTMEDIDSPRGLLHQDALGALLVDRDQVSDSVPLPQHLRRLVTKTYLGPGSILTSGQVGFAYAFADPVPVDKFWIVEYISAFCVHDYPTPVGTLSDLAVYVAAPGNILPLVGAPYDLTGAISVFTQNVAGAFFNIPPVKNALRIDDAVGQTEVFNGQFASLPNEKSMIKKRKVIPPQWSLFCYAGQGYQTSGTVNGTNVNMKIVYSEYNLNEVPAFNT